MLESFSVISNLTVNTNVAVDYSNEDIFLKEIFESKQVTKSVSGSKNNINLTKWYTFFNRASQTCSQSKGRFTCIGQHSLYLQLRDGQTYFNFDKQFV